MKNIGVVSLGCDKNRVDTENMLAFLTQEGYAFTGNPADADVIIVNTCAFIESAKVEAIETILEMAEYKKTGKCKCLVVTGCLPQRYMTECVEELGEVDIFLGTCRYYELPQLLNEFSGKRVSKVNDKDARHFVPDRILTTPYHYAYLKIAEGCDNKCTYCAIPSIRGKYTSRRMEDIVGEARKLIADYGVKELIVVAQDITRYGFDLYGEVKLVELLNELETLDVEWIRLLYCYPESVSDKLIECIASSKKIVKYIDVPMQHASDAVLKRMNRRVTNAQQCELIAKLKRIPGMAIRSTFIVGFPGETEEQFNELLQFVKKAEFDKCGFFAYSEEDGTPAAKLADKIPDDVKQRRVKTLYKAQEAIMRRKTKARIGEVVRAIYEDVDYDSGTFVMRIDRDAPEIDSVLRAVSDFPLDIGEIYNVKITGADGIDYVGKVMTAD